VLLLRPNNFGSGCEAVRLCALPGDARFGDPGTASGTRGSGLLLLLLLEIGLLLPRWGALLLEDPARMREDQGGGMAAVARHRNPSRRSEGLSVGKRLCERRRSETPTVYDERHAARSKCALARCVGRCASVPCGWLTSFAALRTPKSQ
jgi:hypothetical protein